MLFLSVGEFDAVIMDIMMPVLSGIRGMTRKAVGQTKNIFTVGELKVDTNSRTVKLI